MKILKIFFHLFFFYFSFFLWMNNMWKYCVNIVLINNHYENCNLHRSHFISNLYEYKHTRKFLRNGFVYICRYELPITHIHHIHFHCINFLVSTINIAWSFRNWYYIPAIFLETMNRKFTHVRVIIPKFSLKSQSSEIN